MEKPRVSGFSGAMGLLETLLIRVAGLVLLVLAGLTTADALGRYLLNSPIPGTGEIIEDYFMIALIFLPLSYSFMQEGHVHVTMIERYFPGGVKRIVGKVNLLLSFALFALIALAGWERFVEAWRIDEISTSSVGYPMWPCYLMVPIGCGLLCLRIAQVFLGRAQKGHAATPDEDRVA
ncbi:MAG: TRAP transporter small permease [Syntrophales bacterium]|nr:TRAP transporter small permease [Syntrophales bacterium]MCU0582784.1 TRAP transporter small permease [Syntrophales bacterium]